jgi:hypothetical protein
MRGTAIPAVITIKVPFAFVGAATATYFSRPTGPMPPPARHVDSTIAKASGHAFPVAEDAGTRQYATIKDSSMDGMRQTGAGQDQGASSDPLGWATEVVAQFILAIGLVGWYVEQPRSKFALTLDAFAFGCVADMLRADVHFM